MDKRYACQAESGPRRPGSFRSALSSLLVSIVRLRSPKGYSPHDAEDLIQGFFVNLLKNAALTRVDRLKGKFRSFLLASLQNYLSAEAQRMRCLKRGGHCEFVYLDIEDAENICVRQPTDSLTAEKLFDAQWAMILLERAMIRLREQFTTHGKGAIFDTLRVFLGNHSESLSYAAAAKTLGLSIGAAKTLICRFRKQYLAIVRQEIAMTVSDPVEVDGEVQALCDALIAADGRIGNCFFADLCPTSAHQQ